VGCAAVQAAANLSFGQPPKTIDQYDFAEVEARVQGLEVNNPFTDATFSGEFSADGGPPVAVDGFCDSADGSLFRIRFMPSKPGRYTYTLHFKSAHFERTAGGAFVASASRRKGAVEVDPGAAFHFVWQNGEHYFWNGTTAYFLAGWREDSTIAAILERLYKYGVTEARVALSGRVKDGRAWFENVFPTNDFSFFLCPWVANKPEDLEHPELDASRFNVSYWQHFERMLREARERNICVSVVFYVDGYRPGTDPFGKEGMGGAMEQLYYRYALARFAAYSNVFWDLANEYRLFRNDAWANKMGDFVKQHDPYHHLTSTHGHGDFRFSGSAWPDYAMYQRWDDSGGHEAMLRLRQEEARTGRPMPLVNAEYGYEDTYPVGWGDSKSPPARSADTRRRLAWGMYMAGCYQTTGERADRGTGWGPDSGGGWVNGRGDQTMTLLEGYRHIADFFAKFDWWTTEPHDELVNAGAMCLAKYGEIYAIYLPQGGGVAVKLGPGNYDVTAYNPRSGQWIPLRRAEGPEWHSPVSSEPGDWVVLLKRVK
jgi:hypothetical protein